MDVVKGDAKLADYGKESFKFGSDTYTKEEMIAFGKKADTNKFNKMLGIEADDLKAPSHESSGWKYGQTKEDIAKAKSEIINNIEDNGILILNADDKFFNYLKSKALKRKLKIISFVLLCPLDHRK